MEPNRPWVRLSSMRIGVGRRVGPVYVWVSRGVRFGGRGGSGGVGPVGRAAGVVLCVLIAGGMLIGGARVVGGGSFDGRSADQISMEQAGLGGAGGAVSGPAATTDVDEHDAVVAVETCSDAFAFGTDSVRTMAFCKIAGVQATYNAIGNGTNGL